MKGESVSIEPQTYQTPEHGWTCFHCGETFPPTAEGQIDAKRHFGFDIYATPGCVEKVTAPERRLLLQVRALQEQLARYREEDSDADRSMARMQSEHAIALRRAEENGYASALRDIHYSSAPQPSSPDYSPTDSDDTPQRGRP